MVPNIYQNITNQPESLPLKGPWHSLYIGLGWEENPYGLGYSDGCGYDGREDLLYDFSAGYYIGIESPCYINEMKHAYFDTVLNDPTFFARSYMRKFVTAVKTALRFSVISPVLLLGDLYINKFSMPILISAGIASVFCIYKSVKNKTIKGYIPFVMILLLDILVGFVPGMIAVPFVREYLYGAIGCMDFIAFCAYLMLLRVIYEYAIDDK